MSLWLKRIKVSRPPLRRSSLCSHCPPHQPEEQARDLWMKRSIRTFSKPQRLPHWSWALPGCCVGRSPQDLMRQEVELSEAGRLVRRKGPRSPETVVNNDRRY